MFIGRTGRVLSEKSSIEKLYHSIYEVLLKLPHDTMIYPGHDYGYKINDTIKDILGGIRSSCTYVGAPSLKQLSKCTTFVRVTKQFNDTFVK